MEGLQPADVGIGVDVRPRLVPEEVGEHRGILAGSCSPARGARRPVAVARPRLSRVRAVVYDAFGELPTVATVPDPAPGAARRGGPRRGDRPVPQRLARLDGPRPGHPALPARARATSWPASSRRSAPSVARWRAGRSRHRPVRVRLRRRASSAAPATSRSATASPSRASRTGARSPSSSRSTGPTSTSSRCPDALDVRRRGRARLPLRDGLPRGRCRSAASAPGEWVAVHGCGGVGLSAVMIAAARGRARRRGRRRRRRRSSRARAAGAELAVPAGADIRDAHRRRRPRLARRDRQRAGVARRRSPGLRKRGRHVQVGLLPDPPRVADGPRHRARARAARLARHGRARVPGDARAGRGRAAAARSARRRARIGLDEAPAALAAMSDGVAARDHGDPPAQERR